jgi:hypothetical protein
MHLVQEGSNPSVELTIVHAKNDLQFRGKYQTPFTIQLKLPDSHPSGR